MSAMSWTRDEGWVRPTHRTGVWMVLGMWPCPLQAEGTSLWGCWLCATPGPKGTAHPAFGIQLCEHPSSPSSGSGSAGQGRQLPLPDGAAVGHPSHGPRGTKARAALMEQPNLTMQPWARVAPAGHGDVG